MFGRATWERREKKAQNKRIRSSGWEKNFWSRSRKSCWCGHKGEWQRSQDTLLLSHRRWCQTWQTLSNHYLLISIIKTEIFRGSWRQKMGREQKLLKRWGGWLCLHTCDRHASSWVTKGPVYTKLGISENSMKQCQYGLAHFWKTLPSVKKIKNAALSGFV